MTYRFISDPGHGWLEVPLAELSILPYPPSSYSYRNDGFAYLEEDCDAPLFLRAKFGDESSDWHKNLVDVYEASTAIRGYARFPSRRSV